MIPILYDSTEVSFTSNGLGRLADCISCTVTEERNGIYECQFQYPITGEMYPLIQEGCILGVIHDDVKDIQPFDIYGRSAPLNGVVTFFAHHISYRLGNIILKPMTAASCAAALDAIPNNTYTECPFTFWTDKSVSTAWKNEVPNPVKAILGGQQGSILDVYGKGEYEFDKWLVRLYVNRGVDNGVSIRYGVNLTDLRHDIDTSSAYTGVVPFWKSAEDDTVVTLTEGYVMVSVPQLVPLTENNGEEITDDQGRTIYLNAESSSTLLRTSVMDLSEAFEEQPTQEQLRAEALRRLTNSEAWLPSENIKVSFVDLAHTEEYKAVAALQRVSLCDWVSVYCGPLGVSAVSMQVIRVVFNVLNERYNEIELGKARTSFADTLLKDAADAVSDLPTSAQVKSMLATAVDNATSQITGANGGHVRFVYDANGEMQEILIMDTDNIETAVNVWRWNSGGLGFSSHGYAGPYDTAITQNGQFVADMITTGTLDATLIKAGVLDGELVRVKKLTAVDEDGNIIGSFSDSIQFGTTKAKIIIDGSGFRVNTYSVDCVFLGNDNNTGGSEQTDIIWNSLNDRRYCMTSYYPKILKSVTVDGNDVTSDCYVFGMGVQFNTPLSANVRVVINYKTDDPIMLFNLGERKQNTVAGHYSLIQGYLNTAQGKYAAALGNLTSANGQASYAGGFNTSANFAYQHVFGAWNIPEENAQLNPSDRGTYVEIVGNGRYGSKSNARTLTWTGNEWIAGALTQASDSRLKEESGVVPDVSSIRARRFRWNEKKIAHDEKDHIGYFAQDVEKVAPFLVEEDSNGYKSLDYIGLLCAKVEALERKVAELERRGEIQCR